MMKKKSAVQAQTSVTIVSPLGLHARPAAKLVKLAQNFPCTTTLLTEQGSADAQSILDILTLSASQGTSVTVACEGDEAQVACEEIAAFLQTDMSGQNHG